VLAVSVQLVLATLAVDLLMSHFFSETLAAAVLALEQQDWAFMVFKPKHIRPNSNRNV